MYQGSGDPHRARPARDTPAGFSPEATARSVLARLRKLLDDYTPGLPVPRAGVPDTLAAPLNDPILECERLFVRGWLHWLNDEPAAAPPLLAEAMSRAREQSTFDALAESAYWCARVRLLLGQDAALADFESVLRSLGGSPRATVWFIDLLGRAGRSERAEQVWKSLRGNRRIAGIAEGLLLEARFLLRRGELTPAERLLSEAAPANGVVWVERLLLLAWIAATQKQAEKARSLLRQANDGPYPLAALRNWAARIEQRLDGAWEVEGTSTHLLPELRDFLRGQQARQEGRIDEAIPAYRSALGNGLAQPLARYALACLGQEDMAAQSRRIPRNASARRAQRLSGHCRRALPSLSRHPATKLA
jgi:tetratricopeptide (TPR) repeat protein